MRLRSESPHQLIALGYSREKPSALVDMPYLSVSQPRPTQSKIAREISRIVRQLLPAWQNTNKRPETYLFDFDRSPDVRAATLDLIIYLHPYECPIMDIPFIYNLFDVGHRVLPFFPEVSTSGEWDMRERYIRERLQRAVYVTPLNARGKKDIIDFYQVVPEKIRAVHLPTPDYALKAGAQIGEEKSLAHLGVRGDFLVYPAQFWPHKNHMLLLRMLKILKEKHGYAPQLVLTGSDTRLFRHAKEGNLPFIKQRAREMGLENQVIFAGFVSREDLIALYRQARALVFPTFLGPENIPPLEAFALGCPVVASQIPGSEEQYGDELLLVDPTKPELWADAVQRLVSDAALRSSLVAKGKVRAAKFTSDDFVRELFKMADDFEPYRCNWTSTLSSVPMDPPPYSIHVASWESRYKIPPRR